MPARLHQRLAAVEVPAFIEGRALDVLASNRLAVALSPRLRPGENRLRSLLLDPEEREFHTDWDAATAEFVGLFRKSVGEDTDDARIVELVGDLSLTGARFRALERATTSAGSRVVRPVLMTRSSGNFTFTVTSSRLVT